MSNRVKLVKTGADKVTVNGLDRIANSYAVLVDGVRVGGVVQQWGIDYPGARAKVQSYWGSFDVDGNPVGVLGWSDYREDAVNAVTRAFLGEVPEHARMVVEDGTAVLTPVKRDFRKSLVGDGGTAFLNNQSAQFAVEALGRNQRLVIEGVEYELDELRLRKVGA